MKKKYKKRWKPFKRNVLTYGTFDLFHLGHERILKRAKKQARGGKLFVGVSSDSWNAIKGKKSVQSQKARLDYIKKLPYVFEVFYEDHKKPEQTWERDYIKYNIDLIVMGSDHEGKLDHVREKGMRIKYLSRTKGISTTQLKNYVGIKTEDKSSKELDKLRSQDKSKTSKKTKK